MTVTQKSCLISPVTDFMFIGGLSLIVYSLVFFSNTSLIDFDYVFLMWVLSFFVNGPHFIMSYKIFYFEFKNNIFKSFPFFFVGILVPAFLMLTIFFGLRNNNKYVFVFLLYLMFFTVGWHYIKQSFGCFLIYSRLRGSNFTKQQINLIKVSLYALWLSSFFNIFTSDSIKSYWGLQYKTYGFLSQISQQLSLITLMCAAPIIVTLILFYAREKNRLSITSLTPLVCVFIWLSPALKNEVFFYMIPFFHSLQYILFTYAYNKNKKQEKRVRFLNFFWSVPFVVSALIFYIIPTELDSMIKFGEISNHTFLISVIFFINIHHYFLDSRMWRRENNQVVKYLFHTNMMSTGKNQ